MRRARRKILSTQFRNTTLQLESIQAHSNSDFISATPAQPLLYDDSDDEDTPWASTSKTGGNALIQIVRNGLRFIAPVARDGQSTASCHRFRLIPLLSQSIRSFPSYSSTIFTKSWRTLSAAPSPKLVSRSAKLLSLLSVLPLKPSWCGTGQFRHRSRVARRNALQRTTPPQSILPITRACHSDLSTRQGGRLHRSPRQYSRSRSERTSHFIHPLAETWSQIRLQ